MIGAPARIRFPVPKTIVHSLLLWLLHSVFQHRNCLSTALATILCSRPSKESQFQSCDFWPDFHTSYGIPGYDKTDAFNIKKKAADNHHLWPMQRQSSTRSSNWRYWSIVITWLCLGMLLNILPMSLDFLQAFNRYKTQFQSILLY